MGGGVGGVRAGRVVDGTLALGTVASGSSEGVERRKWPTAARVSEFGTAAGKPLFVVLLESRTSGATWTAIL